ncbi:MAG: folate-binding protein [Edaphobacter sp.]|uniref:CAF17-like 4Fe-4S cluster assembly/insertion protein YgfZ n=1 Tax=Edaphobacter sp. TaxID=1934404 RepID=UPI0023A0036D|nr:folate-binding protein [Edaphobacter sp.]MDE1177827.1 folate-binding protein [Edaphobacter sp.]
MTTASIPNTPTELSTTHPQLNALLQDAGVAPLTMGWIRVTGSDRERWLNGMATNSVQQLTNGKGAYNFFLNAQGRIQGDGTIFAAPDALLLETAQAETLVPYLDHYIIMDDVELADVTTTRHGIQLIGPRAPALLAKLGLSLNNLGEDSPGVDNLGELESASVAWNGLTLTVIHAYSPLVPRFELWLENASDAEALLTALKTEGALAVDADTLNTLRILEGTPLYGIDIRNSDTARDLPQETNQSRALHFAKGCYLGQEIVERIRSRGNVHRTFTAFRLEGQLPDAGVVLQSAGKPAGELTSIVSIAIDQDHTVQLALGYARREALDRHEPLQYPGGTAHTVAIPALAEIKTQR